MGLLNAPDWAFALTVKCPAWPAGIVIDEGEALKFTAVEPLAALHDGLYLMAPDIWLARLGFPTACTYSV